MPFQKNITTKSLDGAIEKLRGDETLFYSRSIRHRRAPSSFFHLFFLSLFIFLFLIHVTIFLSLLLLDPQVDLEVIGINRGPSSRQLNFIRILLSTNYFTNCKILWLLTRHINKQILYSEYITKNDKI